LYDGCARRRFDALGSELKDLALILAPDVDARAVIRCVGKTGEELEMLEGKADEVSFHPSWPPLL